MHDLRWTAFIVTMFYHDGSDGPRPVTEGTPQIRNVRYSDITVDGTENAMAIRGLTKMPIEDFSLVDVSISGTNRGVRMEGVEGMYLRNVSVDAAEGPAFEFARISDLELECVADPEPEPDHPVVSLSESDALIRSCVPAEGTGIFVERDDSEVVLLANHFANADRDVA